jgi:hypothetical protein
VLRASFGFRLALAAVDEALQHHIEQLVRPWVHGPVILPRRVLGDLQPGRVVVVGKLLNFAARLGEGGNGHFLGFSLRRVKIDVGGRRSPARPSSR